MRSIRFRYLASLVTLLAATRASVAADDPPGTFAASLRSTEVVYDAAGRPDPFINPLVSDGAGPDRQRVAGLAGQRVGEVRLQGLTRLGDEPIAILLASDGIGYAAREGDELEDGRVVAIDFDAGTLTFEERVNDPMSILRYRSVLRRLER